MSTNEQIDFWKSNFGTEYTLRNSRNATEWAQFHIDTWGITKLAMNEQFIGNLSKDIQILEIGANSGMQLVGLQQMGFKNLYGIELLPEAIILSKEFTNNIEIIEASAFDIPFEDGRFDLVFTSGVLIHISPEKILTAMSEMVRCSSEYIFGFEYYAAEFTGINYRGNDNVLWKADYCQHFLDNFNELELTQKQYYEYVDDKSNSDAMYLLRKKLKSPNG